MKLRDIVKYIILAEELSYFLPTAPQQPQVVKGVSEKPSSTLLKQIPKTDVSGSETLLNIYGSGEVKEFIIKCTSKDFTLDILIDDEVFSKTFDELKQISPSSETIDALDENGVFTVILRSITFSKQIKIIISGKTHIVTGFIKYRLIT